MKESKIAGSEILPVPQTGPPCVTPHGFEAIIDLFGDIREYIGADGQLSGRWQTEFLATAALPFPLRLSWDPARTISQMTCHRRLTGVFATVFQCVQQRGLEARIADFGGCFAFRPQRSGSKLSTHSWGIAIDLNPGSNLQGAEGDMDAGLIKIFRAAGFEWGGDWVGKSRDPMHFQFCTGY
ncbi:MAG: M15 family metallopeptidase [Terriglobales bacterium]